MSGSGNATGTSLGVKGIRHMASPGAFLALIWGAFVAIEMVSPWWPAGKPADLAIKSLLLFTGIPLSVAWLSGRLSLMGLRLGNRTLFFTTIATLGVLPFYITAAFMFESMRSYYPQWALEATLPSLLGHLFLIAILIFGTEVLFRGLMVLALREYGLWAVLIHLAPYVYIHVGKPAPELIASVFAGLFWGIIARKSDSIIPSTVSHTLGYFLMDLIIVLG